MNGVVLVGGAATRALVYALRWEEAADSRLLVGEPLDGERRPVERMSDDEVVEEGRVLLPDLVGLRVVGVSQGEERGGALEGEPR